MSPSNKSKLIAVTLLCALLATGCSSKAADTTAAGASDAAASATTSASGAASAAAVKLASLNATELAGFSDKDEQTGWSADSSTTITLSASGASVDGTGAKADGGVVTISEAGTYVVSGTTTDGQLAVDAPEDADVHLVLNGVSITNNDGPAIYVKAADKTVVTLQEGTENAVNDGAPYADTSEDAPTAAIYSKGDMTINGTGKLTVQGNANDGITSKDDLKIIGGTIAVKAADDGIIGRDLLAVKDGSITIEAGGDGMKSTNDTETDKGNVAIVGGTFNITSENDGIQAAASLAIGGGTFDLVTGGGSAASTKSHQDEPPGGFGGHTGPGQGQDQGQEANTTSGTSGTSGTQDQPPEPPQGQVPDQASDQTQGGSQTQSQDSSSSSSSDTESSSAKALKATGDIAIADGKFTIDAADDAIHSKANAAIMGGQYTLSSGDDGIHAGSGLSISGGTIDIAKSYEGIEGIDIAISGGEIHLVASDDGVNVSGSAGSSAAGGQGGPGGGDGATDGVLAISGGYIYVDAVGDGLDSNGSVTMSGGTAIVNGPTNSGNGALDYNGTFEQSGGTLIAAGAAGMDQAPSDDSSQTAVHMTFPSTLDVGTLVTLTDSSGKAVVAYAPAKTFSSIVISSPDLKAGEEYSISTGGTSTGSATDGLYDGGSVSGSTKVVTFKLGDKVTYVNESGITTANTGGGFGGHGGGGRGMGGDRPARGTTGTTSSGQGTDASGQTATSGDSTTSSASQG